MPLIAGLMASALASRVDAITTSASRRRAARLERLASVTELTTYSPFHTARAELLRRVGRPADAEAAYRTALSLMTNSVERAYAQSRIESLS